MLESALSEFKPLDFLNVMKVGESAIMGAPQKNPSNCKGGWKSNDGIRQSKTILQWKVQLKLPVLC